MEAFPSSRSRGHLLQGNTAARGRELLAEMQENKVNLYFLEKLLKDGRYVVAETLEQNSFI